MKKKYVTILVEFGEFKEDVVLNSSAIDGGENYIGGEGIGIGGIGDI